MERAILKPPLDVLGTAGQFYLSRQYGMKRCDYFLRHAALLYGDFPLGVLAFSGPLDAKSAVSEIRL